MNRDDNLSFSDGESKYECEEDVQPETDPDMT